MGTWAKKKFFKEGSRVNQIAMAAFLATPVFSHGMLFGWMSPAAITLQSNLIAIGTRMDNSSSYTNDSPDIPFTDETISWMASIGPFTAILGILFYGFLVDCNGRKFASICMMIPFMICWTIKLSSMKPWALILARAIGGISSGGSYVVAPVYLKEISDDCIRGQLLSFFALFQNSGFVVSNVIGAFLPYKSILWISLTITVIIFFIFLKLPESPSYMVKIGNIQEAENTIAWLRNTSPNKSSITEHVQLMKLQQDAALKARSITFISIVRNKITLRALEISTLLTFLTALSGFFVVCVYAGTVFNMADDGSQFFKVLTPKMQAIFMGTVQLIGSIVATSLVERCGRRWLLLITSFIVGICMAGLAIWFFLLERTVYTPSWFPVTLLSLGMFTVAAGLMPVPFIMVVELFDFQRRAKVQIMSEICFNLTAFFVTKSFNPLYNSIGVYSVFGIFACVCWTEFIYTYWRVPETKGKSLEEIYEILKPKTVDK